MNEQFFTKRAFSEIGTRGMNSKRPSGKESRRAKYQTVPLRVVAPFRHEETVRRPAQKLATTAIRAENSKPR